MFRHSAELYDPIYLRMKDYEVESRRLHEIVKKICPSARRLLDVACGTGEHARLLHELLGYEVDGVDLDENLLTLARRKNPDGRFVCADMTSFDLGEQYDGVVCLFSAIGYVRTLDRLHAAIRCFAEHTRSGGVVIVEPWFPPGFLDPGRVFLDTVEEDDVKIARMAYTEVRDRLSLTHFEYLVGTRGAIRRETETHELGLFTIEEMRAAFEQADLPVRFEEDGISGRGVLIARKD